PTRLETARAEAERGREELALVGQLSATLSGPLTAPAVATQFLSGIEALLPPAAVATLLQYEESAEAVRIIAQRGGGITPRPGLEYPVDALPPAMRTRLIGDQKSFVVDDTSAVPDWAALVARIPGLARAASFAAIPLVSRSRLIGALVLAGDRPNAVGRDQLQLLALLGQYVAGALHNALSIAEADARADREAVVNRISQRIYSNLDPDAVVASALEELGKELAVSRVIVSGAAETGLAVIHEWHAAGVEPVAVGARGEHPLSTPAAREVPTIAVRPADVDQPP